MHNFLRVSLFVYGRHDLSASEEKASELKDLFQGYRRIILGRGGTMWKCRLTRVGHR